jgi:hypothetical protein
MRNHLLVLITTSLFLSCANQRQTQLNFLDEYILADSIDFKNTIIGGLSGLDYANNQYYFVVDDARNPRVLSANITISNNEIKSIDFKNVIFLNDSTSDFYNENVLDLESIFFDEQTNEINLVSEGSIRKGKLPSVFKIDEDGAFIERFPLPKNLSNLKTIKHNAAFEGSSKSIDNKGFWTAFEAPLKPDGLVPTFIKTASPIRITYFDKHSKKATKQYAYQLEHIIKPAKGNINLNGVTAILEYKENHFFVIERTYQNGYGSYGNIVKIFEATVDEKSTNVLEIESLKLIEFTPLKKRLVFDFEDVKEYLTKGVVDNIEGVTLGPKLPNGNQSLVLVADDNFQIYGKQLNQFILLEIQTNK